MLLRLALASLWNRKGSALLTFLAITVSVFVLLAVEQIRTQAKSSFGNTVSGIDLIVGARSGDVNLLLYSVFHLGNASNNISWQSYQNVASDKNVAWAIPISLGDSHKGYRVVGTTEDYFRYFKFGKKQSLEFAKGGAFLSAFDVVLGSEVARKLAYTPGDTLVLSHGLGTTSFSNHDDSPFSVVGILKPTGTPVDQTLLVSLAGIEAIHKNWGSGTDFSSPAAKQQLAEVESLTPKSITAMMVGLQSKLATFRLQRQINTYGGEPLQAILPGVALTQLWQIMAVMENTLRLISALVLVASLLGLAAMLLASIRERQREIAVLRAIGAPPWLLLLIIEAEALFIALGGFALALLLLELSPLVAAAILAGNFSLFIDSALFSSQTGSFLLLVLGGTFCLTAHQGFAAYDPQTPLQL